MVLFRSKQSTQEISQSEDTAGNVKAGEVPEVHPSPVKQ